MTGYDAAGRATGETVTIPSSEVGLAGTYTTSTIYAPDDSPWSVALPKLGDLATEILDYDYNDLGALNTVTGATTYIASTRYTALSERSVAQLGVDGRRVGTRCTARTEPDDRLSSR
ncbi:hypothetical protein ABZX12_04445 [Kribbella sp. NPDC003505]|uniref:hypothetical protein n=1 Tax=Kribbella sp. NPDC003505 TaxID=3154448 RepID=UPI0033A6C21E